MGVSVRSMQLTKLRGGLFPKYRLDEDYKFTFQRGHRRVSFIIPKGFEYDGATMGSFLFWRKSVHESPYTVAHDWIYHKKGKVSARYHDILGRPNGWPFSLTKEDADRIFLEGIRRDVNVQNWRSVIASAAFKTIGKIYWAV